MGMTTNEIRTGAKVRILNTEGLSGMTGTVEGRMPQFDQPGAEFWSIKFDRIAADGSDGLYTYAAHLEVIR